MNTSIINQDYRKQVDLFGIPFDAVTREYLVDRVDKAIISSQPIWLTFINVAILVRVSRDQQMRSLLDSADYRLCDGMGLMYASRLLGKPLPEMVGGPYLLFRLLQQANDRSYGVYLLGSKTEIIEQAVDNIRHIYPMIEIVGFRNGYFGQEKENDIVKNIQQSKAQLLFAGMGFPREKLFLSKYKGHLRVPVCVDVGGAFSVVAGIRCLAPHWMSVTGMEWVYRIWQEPRRLWKRYLTANTYFAWLLARELLRTIKENKRGVKWPQEKCL